MRVLVVEDEFVSRKKITRIVETFAECVAVENGAQALAAFREAWDKGLPFDLACLDIQMPEVDGLEVLSTFREAEKELGVSWEARIRIIMITAHSDQDMVARAIQAGCDDYILKPVYRNYLIDKIEELFKDPLLPEARIIKLKE
ncbi:MAG: response regulator [Thermodesulfobacteriota bacterium]